MSKPKILPVEPLIQCEAGRAKTMQRQSLYSPRTPKWPPSDKGEFRLILQRMPRRENNSIEVLRGILQLLLTIVNRCRLVMKLDKFLCFMFLFAFLALTLHKTRQKHAFFGRITTQKFRLIYSKLTCEPKTKDCARLRPVQRLIATVLFLLLKFPGFHNQSLV